MYGYDEQGIGSLTWLKFAAFTFRYVICARSLESVDVATSAGLTTRDGH